MIPAVTTEQMREVDRLAVEEYVIQIIRMMENAGRNLAELSRRLLKQPVPGSKIIVAAGSGNNGGGGLVCARHLSNWGADVTILLASGSLTAAAELQMKILRKLPIQIFAGKDATSYFSDWSAALVIDCLIGYGLKGTPRDWAAQMIRMANNISSLKIALDTPSGLDSTSGEIYNPCFKADATMTLALPKTGLTAPKASEVAGTVYLADIGLPPTLYRELGLEVESIFHAETIIDLSILNEGLL